jgi:hypothetical protein
MENQKRNKDADIVNNIIAKYSSRARNIGLGLAAFVVVLSVLISEKIILSAFILGMLYIVSEYLYAVSITILNKSILRKYFESIEDGFILKEGKDVSKISRRIANYGSIQMIINTIILIISIFCLI